MFERVSEKKVLRKVVLLSVSTLIIFLLLVLNINKIKLIKEVYIYISIILSFLLIVSFGLIIKFNLKGKLLYLYYQFVDFFFLLNLTIFIIQMFFALLYYPVVVDGLSMLPTLQNEERLIVQSLGKPNHGSIVVLRINNEYNPIGHVRDGQELVKRVIAGPGDYFYFNAEHKLVLNDEVIEEFYLLNHNGEFFINPTYSTVTDPIDFKDYAKINGKLICEPNKDCVVPEDYYFVMGDNRKNSYDSRNFGLVHKSQILGVIKYRRKSFLDWERIQ